MFILTFQVQHTLDKLPIVCKTMIILVTWCTNWCKINCGETKLESLHSLTQRYIFAVGGHLLPAFLTNDLNKRNKLITSFFYMMSCCFWCVTPAQDMERCARKKNNWYMCYHHHYTLLDVFKCYCWTFYNELHDLIIEGKGYGGNKI